MVERHWTNDVGSPGEGDDADPIVRSPLNKLTRDLANGVESRRLLQPDGEIFNQHRAGNVEHEHDVDSARLHLIQRLAQLRTGKSNDEQGKSGERKGCAEFVRPVRRSFCRARRAVLVEEKSRAAAAPGRPRK